MHALIYRIAFAALLALSRQYDVAIAHVHSGHAVVTQRGRLTVLEITSPTNVKKRIALSHPSDYRQSTEPPYEAKLVAESPNHFLIFTDTFESNPGNVQGQCGASQTGERFVHVVALGAIPHETLSVLIDSCLLDIEPATASPEWLPKKDSAGFIGKLTLRFAPDTQPTLIYYVSADGSVSRPEIKADN